MEVKLQHCPNQISELEVWSIIDVKTQYPIGYIYLGQYGMSVDWVSFADGHNWPKVGNIIDAQNALQKYFDMRWLNDSLHEPVRIM